jgi:serine/threonine-protein kinase
MGVISLAWDGQRLVALKRLRASGNASLAAERFRDEAKLSLRVQHPNLVAGLDAGQFDGEDYLALEWVAGVDLIRLVERAQAMQARPPQPVVAAIVEQVLSGLAFAHESLKFVHRDVAPANVLVGFDGTVKLADYGLALFDARRARTEAGQVPGTPGYVAPERLGGIIDVRSDVFAVGAVWFFLLTGVAPHDADISSREALGRRLERVGVAMPDGALAVLARALDANLESRWQSARDMSAALVGALGAVASRDEIIAYIKSLFADECAHATAEVTALRARFRAQVTPTAVIGSLSASEASGPTAAPSSRLKLLLPLGAAAVLVIGACLWVLLSGQTTSPSTAPTVQPSPLPSPVQPEPEPLVNPPEPSSAAVAPLVNPERPERSPRPSVKSSPVRPVASTPNPAATPSPAAAAANGGSTQLEEARRMIATGRYQSARMLLDEAREAGASSARVKALLGEVEYGTGHYAEAKSLTSEAISGGLSAAERARALFYRASSYARTGQSDEARSDLKKVLAIEPGNERARSMLKVLSEGSE